MKILPFIYNVQNIVNFQNSKSSYSGKLLQTPATPLLQPLTCDTVSFGRSAENAEELRALLAYSIPDMYSGKPVLEPKLVESLLNKHIFAKPIKTLIKQIIPLEESLHDVEKQFFAIVKNMVKVEPQYKLSDVIKKIAPEHNKQLLEQQQPIFDNLLVMSKDMPEELQQEFLFMLSTIYKKLKFEPILQPFSAKEFQYKLLRIYDEVSKKNNVSEMTTLKRMINIAKKMPEKTTEENLQAKNIKSKVKRHKKIKGQKVIIKKRADLLTQIEILASETSLKNNAELTKLLSQTRSKIYNLPIIIPFNRKSFIHELEKITNKLEDKKLAHKMIQTSLKLPTSHDSLSAFVMKCVDYSPEKIGYNMICSSVGTIDHLIPFIKKGSKDNIANYGISSAYYNSKRAEMSLTQWMRKHPEIYANCQKQVDRLIELYNNGTFKKVKLPKHYIINFVRRMYNLSPEENRMVLNIDKLQ